jgi:phage baseplate assembly protein W
MAVGVSVKLPLQPDSNDGLFKLNKTAVDAVKQNFKMLLLTEEGEKVMDTNFGVGLRKQLFENFSFQTSQNIRERIIQQTAKYLPFIKITRIDLGDSQISDSALIDQNELQISIEYQIEPLNLLDKLQLKIL